MYLYICIYIHLICYMLTSNFKLLVISNYQQFQIISNQRINNLARALVHRSGRRPMRGCRDPCRLDAAPCHRAGCDHVRMYILFNLYYSILFFILFLRKAEKAISEACNRPQGPRAAAAARRRARRTRAAHARHTRRTHAARAPHAPVVRFCCFKLLNDKVIYSLFW